MVIDAAFVKDDDLVLYCYENGCRIYINVDTFMYKIITLDEEFTDKTYFSIYEWLDKKLFLMTDEGKLWIELIWKQRMLEEWSKLK